MDPLSILGMTGALTGSGSAGHLHTMPVPAGAAAARLHATPEETSAERPGRHLPPHQQMGTQIMSMLLGLMGTGSQRQDG